MTRFHRCYGSNTRHLCLFATTEAARFWNTYAKSKDPRETIQHDSSPLLSVSLSPSIHSSMFRFCALKAKAIPKRKSVYPVYPTYLLAGRLRCYKAKLSDTTASHACAMDTECEAGGGGEKKFTVLYEEIELTDWKQLRQILLHGPEIELVTSTCSTRYTNTRAQTGGRRSLEWFQRFLLVSYLAYFYTLKMERILTSESCGSVSLNYMTL
jgi:hypothetical protein